MSDAALYKIVDAVEAFALGFIKFVLAKMGDEKTLRVKLNTVKEFGWNGMTVEILKTTMKQHDLHVTSKWTGDDVHVKIRKISAEEKKAEIEAEKQLDQDEPENEDIHHETNAWKTIFSQIVPLVSSSSSSSLSSSLSPASGSGSGSVSAVTACKVYWSDGVFWTGKKFEFGCVARRGTKSEKEFHAPDTLKFQIYVTGKDDATSAKLLSDLHAALKKTRQCIQVTLESQVTKQVLKKDKRSDMDAMDKRNQEKEEKFKKLEEQWRALGGDLGEDVSYGLERPPDSWFGDVPDYSYAHLDIICRHTTPVYKAAITAGWITRSNGPSGYD